MSASLRLVVCAALAVLVSSVAPAVAYGGSTRCEGFGTSTTGGANGATYHVTTLADDGPGSLRDAVSQGDRNVVFDVGGEISLDSQIFVVGANITIDGTTAPSPGISLKRSGLAIRGSRGAHDVIVKGIRIREAQSDGIQIAFGAYNVVIDGVSILQSLDGNVDVSGASDVSICWSLLAEPLSHTMEIRDSSSRVTLHNNLIVGSLTSSPGAYIDELGTPATDTTLDMRNNVVLNWENGYGTAVHHGAVANVVKNLYSSPNSAAEDQANALIVCTEEFCGDPASVASAYVAGNRSGTTLPFDMNSATTVTEPFAAPPVTTGSACNTAYRIVDEAGVRPLDEADQRQMTLFVRIPSSCSMDLIVVTLTAPLTAAAGTSVPVDVQIKNRGLGPVEDETTVRVYLSPSGSMTFDPATAVEVGHATTPPVGVDEIVTVTVPVTIPADAGASGFYRLFAVADADDQVVETIETNNATSIDVRVGPDLVVDAVTAPGWAQAGAQVTVTDTVRNRGFSASGETKVKYYFSSTTTVEAGSPVIGERVLPAVTEGTTNTGTAMVTIPESAGAAGTYYVVAVADADNIVVETDETNNTRSAKVQVGPDLVVDSVSGPATAVAGETMTVTDTTRNRGVGGAGESATRFYISTRSVFDSTAISIGQRDVAALVPGGVSTGSMTMTVPLTLGLGVYYVLAIADGNSAVVEANETNNGSVWEVRIGPDLVVDAVGGPASAVAGDSFTITDTTRNRGMSPARASITRFYVSTKTVFDSTAVAIGQRDVPALAAGAVSTGSTNAAVSADLGGSGTYYILAMADGGNAIVEMDETNNTGATWTVRIGPDLVVDALTGPTTAMSGETITVTDTTRNRGVGPATATATRYYFSNKLTFDETAVLLGSRAVPTLAPAATSVGSAQITLPAGLPNTGNFYVIAMADGNGNAAETDETNNALRAWKIVMSPDLIVDSLTGPTTAAAGTTITVTDTIRNRGASAIVATTARYYLSTKTTLDADAVQIGIRAVPSLAAGAVSTESTSLTLPSVATAGAFYVLLAADGAGAVTELSEVNNVRWWRVTMSPDLVVDAVIAPAAAVGGDTINISDTTRNRGASPVAASVTRIYLSSAPVYAPGALLLGARNVPALAAGANSAGTTAVTIPWWVGDLGTYYIVAVADGGTTAVETDETNNVRAVRISIGADLIIDSAVVPASVAPGDAFDVTDFVRNRGVGPSSASTIRFYVSTRKTYDPFLAKLLGLRNVPALGAGEISSGTTTLTMPATTPSGTTRYLIGIVDSGNHLTELNEDNNGRYWPITIP